MQKRTNHQFLQSTTTHVDPRLLETIPKIKSLFEDKYHRPRKRPYYIGQLQVILENEAFPWIVYNAAMQLYQQEYLKKYLIPTKYADKAIFLYHNRYTEDQILLRIT